MSRQIVDMINSSLRIPFPRPVSGGGGGGSPTGRCVYCDANCVGQCVDGKTEAECAALHAACGNVDKAPYQWTQGASCSGPVTQDCGGGGI